MKEEQSLESGAAVIEEQNDFEKLHSLLEGYSPLGGTPRGGATTVNTLIL